MATALIKGGDDAPRALPTGPAAESPQESPPSPLDDSPPPDDSPVPDDTPPPDDSAPPDDTGEEPGRHEISSGENEPEPAGDPQLPRTGTGAPAHAVPLLAAAGGTTALLLRPRGGVANRRSGHRAPLLH